MSWKMVDSHSLFRLLLVKTLLFTVFLLCTAASGEQLDYSRVSVKKSLVWGPGLQSDFNVPVRYFYIQAVDHQGNNITESVGEKFFNVHLDQVDGKRVRIWIQVLDRHDGSYLVRYRLYSTVDRMSIVIQVGSQHVAKSPYITDGPLYHDMCYCPRQTTDEWANSVGCPASYEQIERDLAPFRTINMTRVVKEAVERFNMARRHSFCHYKLQDNKVYRKCYGEHVGFNMFTDSVLLSLTRKMVLPDMELITNLGDWPLETDRKRPLPVMSWCGSHDTMDIVYPTYDITEATLEMMGRISLDIFSTQANTGPKWVNKTNQAFWRGRDSRRERLDLVETARKHPDLIDAALTNMFFFPQNEKKYGKIQKHISFFDFFKYKYQLNIDGTVAAYRFPYLLAGDSVVFKQDSGYYEHFYNELEPMVHYVPVKSDLSDLLDKLKWAKEHDEQVRQIAINGQKYARERLTPKEVLCYHIRLYQQISKRFEKLSTDVSQFDKIDHPHDREGCVCKSQVSEKKHSRDEL